MSRGLSLVRIFVLMFGLVFCSVFGFSVATAGTDQKASAFVLCKNQKNVRTIKVMPEQNDGCSITYSKGGVEQLVGTNRSLSTCKSILQSIKVNLESSKWNCRSVSSAMVTTSSEAIRQ